MTKLTRCEILVNYWDVPYNSCCEPWCRPLFVPSPRGFTVSSLSVPLHSTEHKLSASQETVYPRRTAHSGLCTVHPAAPALGLFIPCPLFCSFTLSSFGAYTFDNCPCKVPADFCRIKGYDIIVATQVYHGWLPEVESEPTITWMPCLLRKCSWSKMCMLRCLCTRA